MFYLRRNKNKTKKNKKEFSGDRRRDFSLLSFNFGIFILPTSDSIFEIMAFLSKAGLKDDAKEIEPKERVTC